jgi:small subunit ribosomal protein S3Ae
VATKDGKVVELTVTCFTLTRANLSQVHAIRQMITGRVLEATKEMDLNGVITGIVSGEISKDVFKSVKTLFPVRRVEVIKSRVGVAKVV